MLHTCAQTIRFSVILLVFFCSEPVDFQHISEPEQRGVQRETEAQVDTGVQDGQFLSPGGQWGSWSPWTACSRSCGGGVQEQTRPCLPPYTLPRVLSRPPPPSHPASAPQPSLPSHSNVGQRYLGELRARKQDPLAGRRRLGASRIAPGNYGYGRMPFIVPLRKPTSLETGPLARRQAPRLGQVSPANHMGPQQSYTYRVPHFSYDGGHQRSLELEPSTDSSARVPLYQPRQDLHSAAQSFWAGTYNPLPASSCAGAQKNHRLCNSSTCPPASRGIREVQCSSYNSFPFMGRLYEWEPFNEVQGDQSCELNCRAVGFRFYVRQSDSVIDGTPCGQSNLSVCVAGKCQSLGCDDFLGSDKVVDRCGVCGGDNTACKVVSGIVKHTFAKMGYHKIVEIPEGATKINITEMVKSRNYLALRSRSGRSIINGNWAIDRPGKYQGVGTMFTYQRPNEISSTAGESFVAEGPTNEMLDVYMIYQQPNPGVHYEFILPVENPQLPSASSTGNALNGEGDHEPPSRVRYPSLIPDEPVLLPRHQREYNWKLVGTTDCSASCGRGTRRTVFGCVRRVTHEPVGDELCDSVSRPSPQEEACNVEPCPAFWDIGEWSECSRTCGLGTQHRQVLCRQVYANHTLTVPTGRCQHLERPETASTCQLKICSEWQIRSEWTSCSVPCGVGQRTREVRCVSNVGDFVPDDECNMKLRPNDVQNCDMGACAKSWFFSEWSSRCSAECGMGVQTRSVLCLKNLVSSLPLDGCGLERPLEFQACNSGPCENRTEWFTGPWSQCSAECGPGNQQRAVVCLAKADASFTVLPPSECSSLERPPNQQSCQLKACGAKWYHTDWSACSKTCEGGFQVREVCCFADQMVPSEACEDWLRPEERRSCHPEPCLPEFDENCQDKYYNCNVVVQARLCVYDYYQTACCASCRRVAQRQSGYKGRR
ncbi:thrombospondin type-1 domain-containing protein 4-like isoform X1 [Brienomyrus brachyistius]|uniref:thrombospondin type-1 domain-containing protein 4-like isoform X1 n=1 Tax=Brienomyrus brachyistius TaxID=42636 RepID=UPI0020B2334B|nr:thrombospondin type-1 domain-containing protein 4-like isoform X1 [Brienomyrus brachyistius]XP_048828717.1 thrombospondin type-1 domain-containing protein 4-like isoform X1 [Brienomyrus brachyistius]